MGVQRVRKSSMLDIYSKERLAMVGHEEQLLAQELDDIATLTWEHFKREFDGHLFPEITKQQKVLEFAN